MATAERRSCQTKWRLKTLIANAQLRSRELQSFNYSLAHGHGQQTNKLTEGKERSIHKPAKSSYPFRDRDTCPNDKGIGCARDRMSVMSSIKDLQHVTSIKVLCIDSQNYRKGFFDCKLITQLLSFWSALYLRIFIALVGSRKGR